MISASHNPFADNGIKLFAPGGRKLTDDVETALEAELHALLAHQGAPAARTGDAVGTVVDGTDRGRAGGPTRWSRSIEGRGLDGLSVVVDCANGAASRVGAQGAAGARRRRSRCSTTEPDGTNINAGCGSTHPEDLQQAVVAARAPTSGSPSTATPTGCSPSTPTAG